jgi:hypothetical protein
MPHVIKHSVRPKSTDLQIGWSSAGWSEQEVDRLHKWACERALPSTT